jgi:hypothetical protein
MVPNNWLFHSFVDEGGNTLIDFGKPRLDENDVNVTEDAAMVKFGQWEDSVQYETRRPKYESDMREWKKLTSMLLIVVRAHLSPSALKLISVPFSKRDPVAVMAALLVKGMPTDVDITDDASARLFAMSWDDGKMCDLKTKFDDVAKALVAAGEPEPTESQYRALLMRVINKRDAVKYGGAIQTLTINGETDMEKWWRVLMNIEGKGAPTKPPARQPPQHRAHAAAAYDGEDEPDRGYKGSKPWSHAGDRGSAETRDCSICGRKGHLARDCRDPKATSCDICKWTRDRNMPWCPKKGCKRGEPRKESAKVASADRKESAKVSKSAKPSKKKKESKQLDSIEKTMAHMVRGYEGLRKDLDRLRWGSDGDYDSSSDGGSVADSEEN